MPDVLSVSKKNMLNEEQMIANCLSWYALATSDKSQYQKNYHWYRTAYEKCVEVQLSYPSITLDQVIDVVAILSPGTHWEVNIDKAVAVIEIWLSGVKDRHSSFLKYGIRFGYSWEAYDKAWGYLDGTWEFSWDQTKTKRFSDNIRFYESSVYVTIDLHMAHILLNTGLRGPVNVGKYYFAMETAVIKAAGLVGIQPYRLQAILWGCRVNLFSAGYNADSIQHMIKQLVP